MLQWSRQLRRLAEDILSRWAHLDDPTGSGPVFPIDMRSLAHTLIEMVGVEEGTELGAGYLRINQSPKYPHPPMLAAQKKDNEITVWPQALTMFASPQMELEMF